MAQYKTYLLEEKKLAPNSAKRTLRTLKTFYKWLILSNYVTSDPTIGIEDVKVKPAQSQELEPDEVARIFKAIDQRRLKERDRALWTVLLYGLRAEEVSNLNVGDYDRGELVIRQAKHDSVGEVPLTTQGKADLDAYLAWRSHIEGRSPSVEEPLFVSYSPRSRGQRLTYSGIRQAMDQLADATGINLHARTSRTSHFCDGFNC